MKDLSIFLSLSHKNVKIFFFPISSEVIKNLVDGLKRKAYFTNAINKSRHTTNEMIDDMKKNMPHRWITNKMNFWNKNYQGQIIKKYRQKHN